jgi:hypothetical protein
LSESAYDNDLSSPKLVTLINVFTVEPANQQQLLELLARATETSVRHAPSFISSSLHRGLDGTKVCTRNGAVSKTYNVA